MSVHEMQRSRVAKDLEQWGALIDWLALRLETPLTARDLLQPDGERKSQADNVHYLADLLADRAARAGD